MNNKKGLWITLSLFNLCIVAFFGMMLRSKFVFSLPVVDYRSFLSAHSHFAFGGWVTLALFTLLVYDLLPKSLQSNIYQWLLAGIEITALGMALTFPFEGYAFLSITFSTLFLFIAYAFCWRFLKDSAKANLSGPVHLLAAGAIACFVISTIGPLALAYILATKSTNGLLYRDAVYTFLHFQYNGFFTLTVFALFFNKLIPASSGDLKKVIYQFSILLCASILPSLFLTLFSHAAIYAFHVLGITGGVLILLSLIWFFKILPGIKSTAVFSNHPAARILWQLSFFSFVLKMMLQAGTMIPQLALQVFGDRPAIIGFLHLVFLGFVTFYILSAYTLDNAFNTRDVFTKAAVIIFSSAIIGNEVILMFQGVGVIASATSALYPWLLWSASVLLFSGALLLCISRLSAGKIKKDYGKPIVLSKEE